MRALFVGLFLAVIAATGCGPSSGGVCTPCGEDSCVHLDEDNDNCGACGNACESFESCVSGECIAGAQECDSPGQTEDCYSATPATNGVGPCHGGTRTCLDNGFWSACEGEVTPLQDVCGNGADEDCSGVADDERDQDGDGFTNCNGDCCDHTDQGCTLPTSVNPGAFEAPGNNLDDDCDGNVDNVSVADCDTGLASGSATGLDYAKAIDLCQTTTMTGTTWGVIDAVFSGAGGTGTPDADQRSIRDAFGGTTRRFGNAMALLSSGHAAAPGQTNPAYADFEIGQDLGGSSGFPADWLTANGGSLPNAPGCPDIEAGTTANDPIMLTLRIRVPTNARSFSLSTNFFSAEYPEWTCSPYNDFFVVLLDSAWTGTPANPTDKNLAFYTSAANQNYPVGVNLAYGNTGLFTVCENGGTGCAGQDTVVGTINTCLPGSLPELTGTGFDLMSALWDCDGSDNKGGGTGWLETAGNVAGGEIMTLRIAIWDTSDGIYDSLALIDNFQWSIEPSDPGTVIDVD